MNGNDLDNLGHHFVRWLDDTLPTLTASNSINVHIDELCKHRPAPQAQIDASLSLFGWMLSNVAEKLTGKIVMLLIPLRGSENIDPTPPTWGSLAPQLSRTPPSIYVMAVTAFLQPDPAQRYVSATEVPPLGEHAVAAYYQCWRLHDDPEEDGWTRDLRLVFVGFVGS